MTDTPNRPPLSHAAQAVLDAALPHQVHRFAAAAALRAAADQVAPEQLREPHGTGFRWGGWAGQQGARRDLLAIAAELEGVKAEPPRRHVFPTPHQIAECGGPCEQGGPEACDCGLYERSASKSTHLEVGDE